MPKGCTAATPTPVAGPARIGVGVQPGSVVVLPASVAEARQSAANFGHLRIRLPPTKKAAPLATGAATKIKASKKIDF